jgi:hypothetical protein
MARSRPGTVGLADEFIDPDYPVTKTPAGGAHAYRRQNRGYDGLALSLDGQDESPT